MLIDKNKMTRDYRLKDLIRYNTRTKITNESVAEHSFYVVLYTLELCKILKLSDSVTANAVSLAVVHDMAEIDLCDIPHDVKVNNPKLTEEYNKVEDKYLAKLFKRFKLDNVEEKTLENKIVKVADLYSVIQYCNHEKTLGNRSGYIDVVLSKTYKLIYDLEEELIKISGGK